MDSRQRILEHMKRAGEASVAELSRALRLTPVTIRHHLEALQSERLLEAPEARRKTGPGRPEMVYRLSPVADRSMPRNYGELCACLLREFEEQPTGRALARILTEVGEREGQAVQTRGEPGSRSRRGAVQEHLEQRGYFPQIEREDGHLKLTLANCPYLEAARATPALCLFDLGLLQSLFGRPVRMAGRIVQQAPVCTFYVEDGP
jgi:predicted ArsR family transcriptional regulator